MLIANLLTVAMVVYIALGSISGAILTGSALAVVLLMRG